MELPGEPVVTKQTFDGFLGTNLDEVLTGAWHPLPARRRTGYLYPVCCSPLSTATQLGYLVSVVSDCCSDRDEVHHATLAAYPFVFSTVRSDQIAERRDDWDVELDRMEMLRRHSLASDPPPAAG